MDSSLHSILAAQLMQDRIAEATAARRVREVKAAARREALPRTRRRWLGRRTGVPVTPVGVGSLPPR
jgi:hypothetical protein